MFLKINPNKIASKQAMLYKLVKVGLTCIKAVQVISNEFSFKCLVIFGLVANWLRLLNHSNSLSVANHSPLPSYTIS